MAIAILDNTLVRLTLKGIYAGSVETRNVFWYAAGIPAVTANSGDLIDAAFTLWDAINADLQALTSTQMAYYALTAEAMDLTTFTAVNGEDYTIPTDERTGTVGGDALPPFVAWSFKYVRPSLAYRHGWKRFCGVAESQQNTGGAQNVGVIAAGDALAASLSAVLPIKLAADGSDADGSTTLTPVVIRSERGGFDVRPVTYASPATVVFWGIGSQNSRKYGAGI